MSAMLPPNLVRLFQPRPPLPYLEPVDKDVLNRRETKYTGSVAEFLESGKDHDRDYTPVVPVMERIKKKRQDRLAKVQEELEKARAEWDPERNAGESDPLRTLFVGRL
ncbi:hypothetical protein HDU93_008796, partial [Gonapodya sp. JEL0774]